MMQQYVEIKEKNPNTILFFRLGDFYEMFFDDALTASRELEIVLTKRDCGGGEKCPMCGIPHHVADVYISKLVSKGYKVAICEQLEDPKKAKKLVKRDIVQVVTPGTIIDSASLDSSDNNYLMSVSIDKNIIGISYVDINAGLIKFTEINYKNNEEALKIVENEIAKIAPSEIIFNDNFFNEANIKPKLETSFGLVLTEVEKYDFNKYVEIINKKLEIDILKEYKNKTGAILSLGSLLDYIYDYQEEELVHLKKINYYEINDYLDLDSHTIVNLELQKNLFSNTKKGSLFSVLDKTKTSMGSRLLHNYIERPLMDKEKILYRQNIVEGIFSDSIMQSKLTNQLKDIYDLERITGKLSYGKANGRDLNALKYSIEKIPKIKEILLNNKCIELKKLAEKLDDLEDIYNLIDKSIVDEPPVNITEGGLIKEGFDKELDKIRNDRIIGKEKLVQYEIDEREKTGIKNLKIVYNKNLGYFLNVTKSNIKNVPENYVRKQTLTNSERYTTIELEKIQNMILGSESEIFDKEYEIFNEIRKTILENIVRIQKTSEVIAKIDVSNSLAIVALENNYIRPEINNFGLIEIFEGRHPVVEKSMDDIDFISNNTLIGSGNDDIQIITGPNMSGKSTYLRQIALIVIMAQIGSFVPATRANISIVDKIFTRIGASDNLYKGESTFMVEMNEMSNIIKNSTKNSLLILDEVGRGTSTYDGLSIAWSILEYISKNIKAKTLFATHYHELTDLENELDNVINMKVEIEEYNNEVIFLRKVVRGFADKSYGIEVARLAGMPKELTDRANAILKSIESKNNHEKIDLDKVNSFQIGFEDVKYDNFIKEIEEIDINLLSPMDAFSKLDELINKARNL